MTGDRVTAGAGRHGAAGDIGGGDCGAGGRHNERADILAYLCRRRRNAALVAARSPEFAEWAADRRRQLDVMIEEIKAGLHLGCAATEAALADPGEGGGE